MRVHGVQEGSEPVQHHKRHGLCRLPCAAGACVLSPVREPAPPTSLVLVALLSAAVVMVECCNTEGGCFLGTLTKWHTIALLPAQ
jgi:hypothetical protein